MYPEEIVEPCRIELTEIGVEELRTALDVKTALENQTGTMSVFFNSVCGCSAASGRPAVRLALKHTNLPDRVTSVFAGVDTDATAKARSFMPGYQPSSPSIALFKNGELVYFMERHAIEGRHPQEIAKELRQAFDAFCNKKR